MTLQNIDGKVQDSVLKKEHWRLFEEIQGSDLHSAIIAKLQIYLEQGVIDSSIAGSEILGQIRSASPQLLEEYSEEITGGLFGMTLWNLLAEHQTHWCFYRKGGDPLDSPAGMTYFRLRE